MKRNAYSVTQVNAYVRNMFAQDFMLRSICIKGEISNCKYHSSGHIYFTLKDDRAAISAVLFAGIRGGLTFRMREGDQVLVTGSVEVYERDGRYQLYAKEIERDGEGSLYLKFEALKRELLEMGMFAEEYKKPIPRYIRTLGIVTAPTGAAVRDIQNIAARRNPYVQLLLYPARVQGDGAAESIVNGIRELDCMGVDVIIAGRGGGSIEDLWAFNEECVARAIFECQAPVISAVGHETDTTIADFAADLRAPTPSAAAELAVYDIFELLEEFSYLRHRLCSRMEQKREAVKSRYLELSHLVWAGNPKNRIHQKRQYAVSLEEKLHHTMREKLTELKHRTGMLAGRLDGVSPAKKLSQGLAYVTDQNGTRVGDAAGVRPGETIGIRFRDGAVSAKVLEVNAIPEETERERNGRGKRNFFRGIDGRNRDDFG